MNTLENRYKICNFTSAVSSIAAVVSAIRDDRGHPLPAVCSFEMDCAQLSQKVVQCLSFQFLLGYSLMCPRVKNLLHAHCAAKALLL